MKKSVFENLHQNPSYVVLYSLAFLYAVTSVAVCWSVMWELGARQIKAARFAEVLFMTASLVLSVVFLKLMKCISTAVWLWMFGEDKEQEDNRRYLPFAAGICVSFFAALGFRDITCAIGYYTAVDLGVLPSAMIAAWLLGEKRNRISREERGQRL